MYYTHFFAASFCLISENLPSRINKTKPAVMFTGYENKNDLKIVKDLGGTVTTSVSECTVLVANKIGRTAKLLCALGKIFPIYFIILPVFIYYVHTYFFN